MRLFTSFFIILPFLGIAQKEIATNIEKVTVFQRGAQIIRSGEIQLGSGTQTLLFNHLTQNMDPGSIALKGEGNFTILSMTHKNNYLSDEDKNEKILDLEQEQKDILLKIEQNKAAEDAFNSEKQMIMANQKIGGETGISTAQLQQTASFFNTRIKEINLSLIGLRKSREEMEKQKQKIDLQLQEEKRAFAQKTSQILVQIEASSSTKAHFQLSYLVSNAGWLSEYDGRVNDLSSPLILTHKANIVQQTGEDWKDVNLVLSTGVPSAGGQIPYLNPLYVYFRQAATYRDQRMNISGRNANQVMAPNMESDNMKEEAKIASYQTFDINENITQQEYNIPRKQTIVSSPEKVAVVLRQMEIPAKYEYQIRPGLDLSAFLIARVYNWDQYDLLNGELSLYNQNTYVGKSYLNIQNPDDTLDLSLGRDQGIVVKRNRVKDVRETSLLGSNKIDVFSYKIEVRNTKKSRLRVSMKDRVPISKDEDIRVSITNTSGGHYHEDSGIVKWEFLLEPGDQEEFTLSYDIKYPKDKNIHLN